jgi:hypothetical protein
MNPGILIEQNTQQNLSTVLLKQTNETIFLYPFISFIINSW